MWYLFCFFQERHCDFAMIQNAIYFVLMFPNILKLSPKIYPLHSDQVRTILISLTSPGFMAHKVLQPWSWGGDTAAVACYRHICYHSPACAADACYYLLLSANACYCLLLIATCYCLLLPPTTHYCRLMFATAPATACYFLLLATVWYGLLLLASIICLFSYHGCCGKVCTTDNTDWWAKLTVPTW